MLQRDPDLTRIALGESDGGEDGIQLVEVEVGEGAVEDEASGFEVFVGDAVGGIGRGRLGGNGDGDAPRMRGGDGVIEAKGGGERGGADARE